MTVANALLDQGCEKLVLGCTELSLIKPYLNPKELFTDSLEVLALRTILACKKTPIGLEISQRKGAVPL
jgi:aspartate racemase